MTGRRLMILLLMFFGLAAYVYFFEVQGERRRQAKKEQQQQLIQIDVAKITGLCFLPADIKVRRINSHWQIQFPIVTDADSLALAMILDGLRWMKKGRFVSDNPHDWVKFGLDPYQFAMVIHQGDQIDSLFIGDRNLDGSECYFRSHGSHQVFLVPIGLRNSASKSLFDLREKSILKFEPKNIAAVAITNRGKNFRCQREERWRWWITQPISALADEDRLDAILNQIADGTVKGVVSETSDGLARYGLDRPWLSISLFDSAMHLVGRLEVGEQQNGHYLARNGIKPAIVLINSNLVAQLNVSLYDLRDKTIASFDPDSVTSIWLERPGLTFHCRKDSSGRWVMRQPDSALVRSWKINSLLYRIKDLRVAQFVEPPYRSDRYYGFDQPEIRVKLMRAEKVVADLVVGKAIEDKVYLKSQLSNSVQLVNRQAKRDLSIETADLMDE